MSLLASQKYTHLALAEARALENLRDLDIGLGTPVTFSRSDRA
jgi:hypothetical protein